MALFFHYKYHADDFSCIISLLVLVHRRLVQLLGWSQLGKTFKIFTLFTALAITGTGTLVLVV